MNFFEKFLYFLQGEMERPTMYGWFHLLWILIALVLIVYFIRNKNMYNEKNLKRILCIYGVGALILELLKQIIWSFNYDTVTNIVTWDYTWYAAPFQLCTTPIYVSIICLFLKKGKIRDSFLSYLAFITILGSIATAVYPNDVFVSCVLIDIHTMYLHIGSLVVSLYLLISKEINVNFKSYFSGYLVFLLFALIAEILNISIYHSGLLNGETFNMFYISPYFISSLPIFNTIQPSVPFILFLIIYLFSIFLGGYIIYFISKSIVKKK